ncbi:MAG: RluA family pseudouridine synthase [Treponema sp.]|nr:RluA family pseudouridine synthase [Candidatus Treponema equi]
MKDVSIIYENDEILLINKKCGVSVQGGAGIEHPLDEELPKQLGYKIHLVHRLDKETAGILIVAKNPAAATKWTKLIQTEQVQKEYTAVCFGIPQVKGKPAMKGKLIGTVEAHGRTQNAELFFEVEKTWKENIVSVNGETGETSEKELELSLVHITLGTGRMHQIRIQMAKAGAPLAGDDKHGNFKLNKIARKAGIKKLQLAATRLSVPVDGKSRLFEIPLPEHFKCQG